MMLAKMKCPECGADLPMGEACSSCGYDHDDAPWLDVGDHLEVPAEGAALDVEMDPVEVELEITEVREAYEDRRVFGAELVALRGPDGADVELAHGDRLRGQCFVVEQDAAPLATDQDRLPGELDDLVRRPLVRQDVHGLSVAVFVGGGGLAADDLVELMFEPFDVPKVRQLFLPIVDAVERVHDCGLAHLRLAPWTIRLSVPEGAGEVVMEFLGQSALGDDSDASTTAASTSEKDGEATQNEFVTARHDETTRDVVMPLSAWEDAESGSADAVVRSSTSEESVQRGAEEPAASDVDTTERRFNIEFDEIGGFLEPDADVDDVPVIHGFSPPEMIAGSQAELGPRCDVFNLGMVLYYLIAGRLPPVSVYTRHVPALPARNLRPDFPPGLQSVISRATRPEPSERYPDASALRRAFVEACRAIDERRKPTSKPSTMSVAVDTHVGIAKKRRNPVNQDSVFAACSDDQCFSLVVVADGVSTASYGSGDLASTMLVEEAAAAWEDLLPAYLIDESIDPSEAIQTILDNANDRIVSYVNEHFVPFHGGPHEVMGTTALVMLVLDGTVRLASLGDSRVYLHRGETFEQLTADHNVWTLSVIDGVPPDNALAMPHGDALARCLGSFFIDDHRLEAVPPDPDITQFSVTSGDTLLMTTDGLVDFAAANMLISEDKIHQVLLSEPDPALGCLELILLANRGGGGDNIGVGIVKFG